MDVVHYKARIILRQARHNTRGVVVGFDWEECEVDFRPGCGMPRL